MSKDNFKPRSQRDHAQRVADGRSVPVEVAAPQVYRDLTSGDTYALDSGGRLITGYLPLQLGRVPRYQVRTRGLARFGRDIETAARRILDVLGTPLAVITAAQVGVNLGPARLLLDAMSEESDAAKALRLLDLYGPDRVASWSRAIITDLGVE